MKYEAIIWDLDGTLMDSLTDLYLAVNHALREYSMPERTLDEIRQFVGNGVRRLVIRAVPQGESNPRFEDVFATFRSWYMEHCNDHTRPYPHIMPILRQLRSQGIRMAIVSNKLQDGVTLLHGKWFADTIDIAIGEHPGSQRKPHPDMVFEALHQLGVNPDDAQAMSRVVYIGDSEVDVLTARHSSLPCIAVTWGFRSEHELREAGATLIAHEHTILQLLGQ